MWSGFHPNPYEESLKEHFDAVKADADAKKETRGAAQDDNADC